MGTTIQEIYIHRFVFYHIFTHVPLALDNEIIQKISKGHFLQDIKNSFHGVTQMGLEPPRNLTLYPPRKYGMAFLSKLQNFSTLNGFSNETLMKKI